MTARQNAIVVAALRLVLNTVRDENRPLYVTGQAVPMRVAEVEKLIADFSPDELTQGEFADLRSKELAG